MRLDTSRPYGEEYGNTGSTGLRFQDGKTFDRNGDEVGKPSAKPAPVPSKPADDDISAQLK